MTQLHFNMKLRCALLNYRQARHLKQPMRFPEISETVFWNVSKTENLYQATKWGFQEAVADIRTFEYFLTKTRSKRCYLSRTTTLLHWKYMNSNYKH